MKQDAKRIEAGDIVVIRSGGPRMTVNRLIEHIGSGCVDEIDVGWFAPGNVLMSARVSVNAVRCVSEGRKRA